MLLFLVEKNEAALYNRRGEITCLLYTSLEPVTKRGIPFAVTFGNHDCQVGISNQDQFYHIYKRLPNCIGEQAEGIDGGGTCAIPIEASRCV